MNTINITTPAELAELIPQLLKQPLLALDTEFVRVDTFYPKLGLIQIGDCEREYLIDPVAITDLSPLAPLMLAPAPIKVLHSCSEDMEVLERLLGAVPAGVLDTQIAAAFLGHGLQLGYQKCLQDFLAIDIPKDESRSDWLARPLSPAQEEYAALDVRFLPHLFHTLADRLKAKGLYAWFEADCALMLGEVGVQPDPDTLYQEVNNAWRLRPQELGVLRELTRWREREARARDMPRGFLIKNGSLFGLARKQPQTMAVLADIDEMTPRILRREGEAILRVIAEARALPPESWPASLPPPLPKEARAVYERLREVAEGVAKAHDLPVEVLLRKRHLEALVLAVVDHGYEAPLPVALRGWRGEVLTPGLLVALHEFDAELAEWRALRRG